MVRSRLRFELTTRSGHDFQGLFSILLGELVDGTAQTKRLGQLDRLGIDAITIGPDGASYQVAIQCKGFEVPEYGADQHKQCRAEIAKYKSVGPSTGEYWLVVNRPIKDREMRRELEADLAALVADGRAQKAVLLDSEPMIRKLVQLASAKVAEWAIEKQNELFKYYKSRMEFVQYIDDVPFNQSDRNPVAFLLRRIKTFFENLPEHQTSKYRKPPNFLVTSEFGFGKTSALQALASKWIEGGGHLVYVPAALLNGEAFVNTASLADALLAFIVPEDVEVSDLAHELFRNTLRKVLAKSTDWLVLIDGLDENAAALKASSLVALWNSMADLGVPAIVSVRDEVVETRRAEFFPDAELRVGPEFERLRIGDWPDDLIARFVRLFSASRGGNECPSFSAFRRLIEGGKYLEAYGDIPKRPLFLGMLAEDAWAGKEPARHLHRLYGQYFRKKFDFDRYSMAARGTGNRSSAIVDKLGAEEAVERLICVMQDAADDMLLITKTDDGRLAEHGDSIGERQLRRIAENNEVPFVTIEDIAMHSLLQPAGRGLISRERMVRFAHRSFQDWFLARQYVAKNRDFYLGLPRTVIRFIDAMQADLKAGAGLP